MHLHLGANLHLTVWAGGLTYTGPAVLDLGLTYTGRAPNAQRTGNANSCQRKHPPVGCMIWGANLHLTAWRVHALAHARFLGGLTYT